MISNRPKTFPGWVCPREITPKIELFLKYIPKTIHEFLKLRHTPLVCCIFQRQPKTDVTHCFIKKVNRKSIATWQKFYILFDPIKHKPNEPTKPPFVLAMPSQLLESTREGNT